MQRRARVVVKNRIPDTKDFFNEDGSPTTALLRYLGRLEKLEEIEANAAAALTEDHSVTIDVPANGTIRLRSDSSYPMDIEGVTTKCTSGTVDVEIQIDGVALGGGNNSASSSEETITHTSANRLPVGGDLDLVLSNNSSSLILNVTLHCRRVVDAG
jgi:hypothetical protein